MVWQWPRRAQPTRDGNRPPIEMRAAWIATYKCVDWPSKPGLTVDSMKKELVALMDMHQRNGMNAVVFQVRPAADAFYDSPIEPWSQWLTGRQGRAPEPMFDPLALAIELAHERHMELHAWFNPFRALVDSMKTEAAPDHITRQKPDWFIGYGSNLYFDPGLPEARDYLMRVIQDVVRRYDIDAVHFDDYFYPYKIAGEEFADDRSFAQYGQGFAANRRDDWRRENVNQFVRAASDSIKALKPWVKFGVSPFGVWRNKGWDPEGSDTRAGSSYDELYADVRKWLREGWIDYVAPQIYWNIGFRYADFDIVLDWWSRNSYGRHLYPGLAIFNIDKHSSIEAWRDPYQIPRQIERVRADSSSRGVFLFSSKYLARNPSGINEILRNEYFREPALLPGMPWIDSLPPPPPADLRVEHDEKGILLRWDAPDSLGPADRHVAYALYRFEGSEPAADKRLADMFILTRERQVKLPRRWALWRPNFCFVVTAFDLHSNESAFSAPIVVRMKR